MSSSGEVLSEAKVAELYQTKQLSGYQLKVMMDEGQLSKAERRRILKATSKLQKEGNMPKKVKKVKSSSSSDNQSSNDNDDDNDNSNSKNNSNSSSNLAKKEELKKEREAMVCLRCREQGHLLKYCPLSKQDAASASGGRNKHTNKKVMNICFNCGSTEHMLHNCKEPRLGTNLPFSTCFICNEKGHLARDCTHNSNGLYPNGGGCHICGKNSHLLKDCPDASKKRKKYKNRDDKGAEDSDASDSGEGADKGSKSKSSSVIFPANMSGDTLDDNLAVSLKPMKKAKLPSL